MDAFEMLNYWAKYGEYDPGQTSFNLLSANYKINRCCKDIEKISSFDPTGAISVMYAKNCFLELCNESKIKLVDILSNPNALKEEQEMWDMFHSEDEERIEHIILDTISRLVEQTADKKMLGSRDLDQEKKALLESVDSVVEDLTKCNVDLFKRGTTTIGPVSKFSTHIHVFNYLSECLLALESAEDGIYLCYISNSGTSDGYFGFYIKSNGNILSVNERQDEAYPGQHKESRNGRWQDSKAFTLFPYNFIFSFSEYDYKGYASKFMIDEDKLAFMNLQPGVYIPLLLAMVMLVYKYSGASTEEMKVKYMDSLLPVNLSNPMPGAEALMVTAGSEIAENHKTLSIALTSAQVLDSSYGARFDIDSKSTGKDHSEVGYFPCGGDPDLFIELYGNGFTLDAARLLESNRDIKCLPTEQASKITPDAEFVGSADRLEMIAYMRGREQLAEYIREKMFEEYRTFGGRAAVINWYANALKTHEHEIFDLLLDKVRKVNRGEEENVFRRGIRDGSGNLLGFIGYGEDNDKMDPLPIFFHPFNRALEKKGSRTKLACPITGASASIFFNIRPRDWKDLALLVGEENVPKIVKGWNERGHHIVGNYLLNATDPVTGIGTPFESTEYFQNKRYWTKDRWNDYFFHNSKMYPDWMHRQPEMPPQTHSPTYGFSFVVGFSKRGFKKFIES